MSTQKDRSSPKKNALRSLTWEIPSLSSVDALDVNTLVLLISSDARPLAGMAGFVDWRLCGRVSQEILAENFSGDVGERLLMPTWERIPAERLLLFGFGATATLEKNTGEVLSSLGATLEKLAVKRVALALPNGGKNWVLRFEEWAQERTYIKACSRQ
ncbi:MAG: hypothetical protein GY822_29380 [Deltaproteobacteria bacterium]|nr:hypothetical protein [Deltaproteobacteria bacterium]